MVQGKRDRGLEGLQFYTGKLGTRPRTNQRMHGLGTRVSSRSSPTIRHQNDQNDFMLKCRFPALLSDSDSEEMV